jgi:hypothetical protein
MNHNALQTTLTQQPAVTCRSGDMTAPCIARTTLFKRTIVAHEASKGAIVMSDTNRNILIAVVAAVIILGAGWYFMYGQDSGPTSTATTPTTTTTPPQPAK